MRILKRLRIQVRSSIAPWGRCSVGRGAPPLTPLGERCPPDGDLLNVFTGSTTKGTEGKGREGEEGRERKSKGERREKR